MEDVLGPLGGALLPTPQLLHRAHPFLQGRMGRVVAGTTAGMGALWAFSQTANASEHLHPPSYPWEHNKMTKGLDMKSVRRGYEVYKGVCAQCHSLKLIAYRNFVDNIATEEEAKEV